jgi:hypothetical protein
MDVCVLRFARPAVAATLLAVVVGVAGAEPKAGEEPACTLRAGPTRSVMRSIDAETGAAR